MPAPTLPPQWWTDPSRRHQLRYRDAEGWTDWVADGQRMQRDPDGRDVATIRERQRRRRWVSSIVAIAVGGVVLVSCVTAFLADEQDGADRLTSMQTEVESWVLPSTVVHDPAGDLDMPRNFAASNASVTRSYRPAPGVSLSRAAHDLVASLRARGYDLTHDGRGLWSGECASVSECVLTVSTYPRDQVIDVDLDSRR